LLPGSVPLRLRPGSAEDGAAALREALAGGTRIVVVDASTDADLKQLASAIAVLGERAIPVGAAGLAVAMASAWSDAGTSEPATASARRVVVVVSSLHDVSRSQADHLLESLPDERVLLLAPSLADALDPSTI